MGIYDDYINDDMKGMEGDELIEKRRGRRKGRKVHKHIDLSNDDIGLTSDDDEDDDDEGRREGRIGG